MSCPTTQRNKILQTHVCFSLSICRYSAISNCTMGEGPRFHKSTEGGGPPLGPCNCTKGSKGVWDIPSPNTGVILGRPRPGRLRLGKRQYSMTVASLAQGITLTPMHCVLTMADFFDIGVAVVVGFVAGGLVIGGIWLKSWLNSCLGEEPQPAKPASKVKASAAKASKVKAESSDNTDSDTDCIHPTSSLTSAGSNHHARQIKCKLCNTIIYKKHYTNEVRVLKVAKHVS